MSWKYFNYKDDVMLACPCCGKQGMNVEYMNTVDEIRHLCGFPFTISSGYRCPEYNNQMSGTGGTGPHTTGKALDIKADNYQRAIILKIAISFGFTRFGIGKRFMHLDGLTRVDSFPEDRIWPY